MFILPVLLIPLVMLTLWFLLSFFLTQSREKPSFFLALKLWGIQCHLTSLFPSFCLSLIQAESWHTFSHLLTPLHPSLLSPSYPSEVPSQVELLIMGVAM